MERHPTLPMTPFDEMMTNSTLQTMKLLLPYLPATFQRFLAFYIKLTELTNTFHLLTNLKPRKSTSPTQMFEELKPYMNPQDCESIDSVLSIINMMEMMDEIDLMNLFAPDNNEIKKGNLENE